MHEQAGCKFLNGHNHPTCEVLLALFHCAKLAGAALHQAQVDLQACKIKWGWDESRWWLCHINMDKQSRP